MSLPVSEPTTVSTGYFTGKHDEFRNFSLLSPIMRYACEFVRERPIVQA